MHDIHYQQGQIAMTFCTGIHTAQRMNVLHESLTCHVESCRSRFACEISYHLFDKLPQTLVQTFKVPRWCILMLPYLSFSATMSFTCVGLSDISWELLRGLSRHVVKTCLLPSWKVVITVIIRSKCNLSSTSDVTVLQIFTTNICNVNMCLSCTLC